MEEEGNNYKLRLAKLQELEIEKHELHKLSGNKIIIEALKNPLNSSVLNLSLIRKKELLSLQETAAGSFNTEDTEEALNISLKEQHLLNLGISLGLKLPYDENLVANAVATEVPGDLLERLRRIQIHNEDDFYQKVHQLIIKKIYMETGLGDTTVSLVFKSNGPYVNIENYILQMERSEGHNSEPLNGEEISIINNTIIRYPLISTLSLNSSNITGNDLSKILPSKMEEIRSISKLSLEGSDLGNIGMRLIGGLLRNSNLKELYIRSNSFYDIDGLTEFSQGLSRSLTLNILSMCLVNMRDGAGILGEGIKQNVSLNNIVVDSQNEFMGKETGAPLIHMLSNTPCLKQLCLIKHQISGDFKESLLQNEGIERLFLMENNLGNKETVSIVKGLILERNSKLHTIQYLNLPMNNISDEGCVCIAEGLQVCQTLQSIDLGNNKIGNIGGNCLAESLHRNSKLEELKLTNNLMDDTVAKQLVYYLCVYPHSPKPNIRISICDKRHLYTGILNLVLNKRKTSPQAFIPGEKIKHLELLGVINESMVGRNYIVRNTTDKEIIGLKEISMSNEQHLKEVEWEVQLIKTLNHSNILSINETFVYFNKLYITTQFNVKPLREYISEIPTLTPQEITRRLIRYGRGLAEGIVSLHSSNIAHLNLISEDIYLNENDEIIIGELGISNLAANIGIKKFLKNFITKELPCPPGFAPEIWDNEEFAFEPDIFAFGIILYELLGGERPFLGEDFGSVGTNIAMGKYDHTAMRNIDAWRIQNKLKPISPIIQNALQIDKKKRSKSWPLLEQMNTLHGETFLNDSSNMEQPVLKTLKYFEELMISNILLDKFCFSKKTDTCMLIFEEENPDAVFEYFLESKLYENNPSFVKFNHKYYGKNIGGNNWRYFLSIERVKGTFYKKHFHKGKELLPKEVILHWLIEAVLAIKYLHDNNIYYHNLCASNLYYDNSNKLILGPSKFPILIYWGENKILQLPFPKLSEIDIFKDIKGIYLFWYELCTGKQYYGKEYETTYFLMLEDHYGEEWEMMLKNVIKNDVLPHDNLHDLFISLNNELRFLSKTTAANTDLTNQPGRKYMEESKTTNDNAITHVSEIIIDGTKSTKKKKGLKNAV